MGVKSHLKQFNIRQQQQNVKQRKGYEYILKVLFMYVFKNSFILVKLYNLYTVPFKGLGSVRCFMFFKDVSYAHK